MNSIDGEINGWKVSFSYHRPDTKWGANWAFLSVLVSKEKGSWDFKELMTDDSAFEVSDTHLKAIKKAGLNIKDTRSHMKPEFFPPKPIQKNLKEIEKAIKKVAQLK